MKPGARRLLWIAWATAAVFAAATALLAWRIAARPAVHPQVTRLAILTPQGETIRREVSLASFSPDGTALAFAVFSSAGTPSIWIRRLSEEAPHLLPGSEGGNTPAWSPDGRSVIFATQEKLERVDLRGGAPQPLCDAAGGGRGASWGAHDVIVFAPGGEGPIFKIPATGGTPVQVTTLDSTETGHRFPEFLPDGVHFLFCALPPGDGGLKIYVGSTDGGKRQFLMTCDAVPCYADPGWLVYTRDGRILVQQFDPVKRRLGHLVMTLPDEPAHSQYYGASSVTVSRRGPLAYQKGGIRNTDVIVFNRSGRPVRKMALPLARYVFLSPSPDGSRLAAVGQTSQSDGDLWIVNLRREGMRRIPFDITKAQAQMVWSPDGTRLAFSKLVDGRWKIVIHSLQDGTERVLESPQAGIKNVTSWSPDGRYLASDVLSGRNGWDIWLYPTDGAEKPRPFLASPYDEKAANISPDGRWVAYGSHESGRSEIYVQPFPGLGPRYQLTNDGGSGPSWSGDGHRLVYRTLNGGANVLELRFDDGVRVVSSATYLTGPMPAAFLHLVVAKPSKDLSLLYTSIETGLPNESTPFTIVQNWRSALEPR